MPSREPQANALLGIIPVLDALAKMVKATKHKKSVRVFNFHFADPHESVCFCSITLSKIDISPNPAPIESPLKLEFEFTASEGIESAAWNVEVHTVCFSDLVKVYVEPFCMSNDVAPGACVFGIKFAESVFVYSLA